MPFKPLASTQPGGQVAALKYKYAPEGVEETQAPDWQKALANPVPGKSLKK